VKNVILICAVLPALMSAQALAQTPAPAPAAPATTPPSTATPEVSSTAATTDPAKKAANPLANAVQARTPEEQANQSGLQVATTLDHYLGAGTFVSPELYASFSAYLTIAPQYLFAIGKQRLVASATIRGAYEYTLPDAETGRRWSTYDTRLGVSAPALFKEKALTNISFSPSLSLTIPTSLESWNAGLITAVGVGVTASRSVGTVDFRMSLSGSRAIFGQPYNAIKNPELTHRPNTDSNGNQVVICRPNEIYCGNSNNNLAWSLSVGGQVQWRATGSFLVYAGYSYLYSWREAATNVVDDFTPKALDANGNPVARAGYGRGDRTSTYVGGSYQLNEHYSLDLGMSTVQTPLFIDKDGVQRPRFPFLSLGSWADNATSIYFTLSAAY